MKKYVKPMCTSSQVANGLIPLAVVAGEALAAAGVGAAAAAGAVAGLAHKGGDDRFIRGKSLSECVTQQ